jgi:signal-transduction protein with cAMP-binding, CBS, and nucleotidyltransferase domain
MSDHPIIRVRDVMTTPVRIISGMATVREAINMMSEAKVSSLAVERHDDDDEYGMLVVHDIAREIIATDRSPDRVNVYEIMSKPALTLPSEMQIRFAAQLLVRYQLNRALVVTHDCKPCGIVTLRDMVIRHAADPAK